MPVELESHTSPPADRPPARPIYRPPAGGAACRNGRARHARPRHRSPVNGSAPTSLRIQPRFVMPPSPRRVSLIDIVYKLSPSWIAHRIVEMNLPLRLHHQGVTHLVVDAEDHPPARAAAPHTHLTLPTSDL